MANVKIIKSIISSGNKSRLPLVKKATKWIVIHETGNRSKGANAKSHAKYLTNVAKANMQYYSWHYTVDSKEIYQHMPDNEVAFHAGDGNAPQGGNYMGIGIEICVNPESNFEVAKDNAAWLTAKLLKEHKLTISAVKQHHDFSSYGKNCPETIRNTGTWGKFINAVENYLNGGQANTVVSKPATPKPTPVNTNIKIGTKVSIKSGAVYGGLSISRGRVIPSAYTVNTKQFTVKKIATHKGTQEALLDGISSWVSLSSLSPISLNNPPSVANTSTTKPVANKPNVTVNTYAKGEKLELKNEPLYTTSSALKETKTISGVYYVHDGEVFNNRVRITNAVSRVGSGQVTGWISVKPVSAIPNVNTNTNENAQKNENNYNAGNKVTLKNAQLFSTAYTKIVARNISGKYYIYNGKETNGRLIVTNTPANVGKVPTGWVNKTDIGKSI